MSEENKAAAARIPLEVFSQGKLEVIDEVISAEMIDHGPPQLPGQPPGREGVRVIAAAVREAFPDLNMTISHEVAEGDLVVQHVTTTGTMRDEFAGMPPSGKQATWDSIHIGRLRDGKVVEHWVVQDQLGMLQQLGFIAVPGAAETTG